MKSKDVFRLMIRFFGMVSVYYGLAAVPNAWAMICPSFPHFQLRFQILMACLLLVGWPLAVGLWMVRGAPWLVRFAYAREDEATTQGQP